MTTSSISHYEDLLIRLILLKGINLQKGQKVFIGANPENYPFVQKLVEAAYQAGASYVHAEISDKRLLAARLNAPESDPSYTPRFWQEFNEEFIKDTWCRIRIDSPQSPHFMEHVKAENLLSWQKAQNQRDENLKEAIIRNEVRWCVVAVPTQSWASLVYQEEASEELLQRLWKQVAEILHLEEDVVSYWEEHSKKLQKRAQILNELQLEHLHFQDPRTDLKISLLPQSRWIGGGDLAQDGHFFFPNLPTEEVFTTPHAQKTQGLVYITFPVEVMQKTVEGAWFRFDQGRVIECGAQKGAQELKLFLESDPQATYLGEVALVDCLSPLWKSSLFFHNILYDENSACHIALGSAYPDCAPLDPKMSKKECIDAGVNVSLVHRDFMIGSDQLRLEALDYQGKKHLLIESGLILF